MYINKTILAIIAVCMIVFIALTCHYSSTPLQGSSEQVDTLTWVNNAGDIVSSLKADPSYFEEHDKHLIDSMAKVYKTKPKNVVGFVAIHEQGESDIPQSGSTVADYMPVDSNKKDCPPQIKSLVAGFKNPYYTVDVKIAAPESGDTSTMHISSRDSLTMLLKWVPEGNIFHRTKKLQLDISNANPDNRVYIDHAYRITEKPKRWAIGFSAGYGLPLTGNVIKSVPFVGLTITKSIVRF